MIRSAPQGATSHPVGAAPPSLRSGLPDSAAWMALLTEGVRPLLVGVLGFDEARAEHTGQGLFVVTQQLEYGDVPAPGTAVRAQASLLTASTSTLLIRTDLFDPAGDRVCSVMTRYVHVDLCTRRAIRLPAKVIAFCTHGPSDAAG